MPADTPDQRRTETAFLTGFLAARDLPCPSCGYSPRGLTTDRCPECNRDLLLTVSLAEPRLAAFITGLVGLAFGVGFDLIMAAYVAAEWMTTGAGPPAREFLLGVGVPMLVLVPVLGLWIFFRRRLGAQSAPVRWISVAVAWALTVGASVYFFVLVS